MRLKVASGGTVESKWAGKKKKKKITVHMKHYKPGVISNGLCCPNRCCVWHHMWDFEMSESGVSDLGSVRWEHGQWRIYNTHGHSRYLSQDQSKEREPTSKGHGCQSSALQNMQHHGWMNTNSISSWINTIPLMQILLFLQPIWRRGSVFMT